MLTYRVPGQTEEIAAVSAGLIKIENDDVLVLVDAAERPEEIDANRAQRAADEAKETLLQKRSILEYRLAQSNLARAGRLYTACSLCPSWRLLQRTLAAKQLSARCKQKKSRMPLGKRLWRLQFASA